MKEDVLWLDVSMEDFFGMEVLQCIYDLIEEKEDETLSGGVGLDVFFHRSFRTVFHDEVEMVFGLFGVDELNDVSILEMPQHIDLTD